MDQSQLGKRIEKTAVKLWCRGRNRTRAFMRFVKIATGVWFENAEKVL